MSARRIAMGGQAQPTLRRIRRGQEHRDQILVNLRVDLGMERIGYKVQLSWTSDQELRSKDNRSSLRQRMATSLLRWRLMLWPDHARSRSQAHFQAKLKRPLCPTRLMSLRNSRSSATK